MQIVHLSLQWLHLLLPHLEHSRIQKNMEESLTGTNQMTRVDATNEVEIWGVEIIPLEEMLLEVEGTMVAMEDTTIRDKDMEGLGTLMQISLGVEVFHPITRILDRVDLLVVRGLDNQEVAKFQGKRGVEEEIIPSKPTSPRGNSNSNLENNITNHISLCPNMVITLFPTNITNHHHSTNTGIIWSDTKNNHTKVTVIDSISEWE